MSDIKGEISRVSLSEQVYHFIKSSILDGTLKAGQRIPEDKIARRFGVSRTPIREAIRRLSIYGLVDIKPRSYAEVVGLRPEEAEDVAYLRASLETLAVRQLASRGSEEDFICLTRIADQCENNHKAGKIEEAFEEDSRFHLEIARRSGNRHLFLFAEKLDAKVQMLRLVLQLPSEKLALFIAQHRDILVQLREGDAYECDRIIRNHILDQLNYYQ